MTRPTPRITSLLLAAVLAVTAAGCGEKDEPLDQRPAQRDLDLALDWFPNPDHVAIYEALDEGHYQEVGLAVKPRTPSDPSAPIKEVAAGRADLAVSYEPEVFLARSQGLPVLAVAALVQRPLTSLMATRESGVRSVSDLRGERIGTAGIPYQSAYLETILREADVPASAVNETNVGTSLLPAMLSGKVAATLGAFWNVEGVEMRQRGKRPFIRPVDRLGVPDYDELVLVANEDSLEEKRDDVRLFIAATARGAEQARKDPRGAARAVLDANPDLKPRFTRESVRVTLPTLFPENGERPWGHMEPAAWRAYGAWMARNGLLEGAPEADGAFTNELLPGEGLTD